MAKRRTPIPRLFWSYTGHGRWTAIDQMAVDLVIVAEITGAFGELSGFSGYACLIRNNEGHFVRFDGYLESSLKKAKDACQRAYRQVWRYSEGERA